MTPRTYMVVTQQPWGAQVFDRVTRNRAAHECWMRVVDAPGAPGPPLSELVAQYRPDKVFLVHFSDIVPASVYETVECINFHCTPLPYGRGGHPIENLLLLGYRETVITAHRVTGELDAGPVYGRSAPVSLVRYIAPLKDAWFDPGTEVIPVCDAALSESALPYGHYLGMRGGRQEMMLLAHMELGLAHAEKEEILNRFAAPVAQLILDIVDLDPNPQEQAGPSRLFRRLSPDAYRKVWEGAR